MDAQVGMLDCALSICSTPLFDTICFVPVSVVVVSGSDEASHDDGRRDSRGTVVDWFIVPPGDLRAVVPHLVH